MSVAAKEEAVVPVVAKPVGRPLRALFALPGLHRVNRGAEVALESVAQELSRMEGVEITMIGTGNARADRDYRYVRVGCLPRERFERWPRLPVLRDHYVYEEASYLPGLLRAMRPDNFDVTFGCSYPFTNWALRARRRKGRPRHIYITQNGDWPLVYGKREFRWFGCDGLICTNPEYFERHRHHWPSRLIPNGVDPDIFRPGPSERSIFDIPEGVPLVLMVSAIIPSKRVLEGIEAVALSGEMHLLVLGDGELTAKADAFGRERMGERYRRMAVPRSVMPAAYRSADVFLHMSLEEPSANAYIEALATGLPVVTHDRMVTRWTFEDAALLVDAEDIRAVAQAITDAVSRRSSDLVSRRRELARRRFAWSTIAEQYAAFARELAA